jgi:hypothetical protein
MTDYRITPGTGRLGIEGQPVTLKHVAKWWVWKPLYLVPFITVSTVSLIFGCIPRWGLAISVVCTIIATFTGFKAGVKYHREVIR